MRAPRNPLRTHRAARAAALAAACALTLGACGGDDETTTASEAPTSTSTTTSTADPGPASDLRNEFNDLITETLTEAEGLSPAVARCAVNQLERTIDDDELTAAAEALAETGDVPADLVDAAFEAGRDCAGQ
jgi:hypothetical protein